MGGHIVSGHIDCTAKVLQKRPDGEFTLFSFHLPEKFGKYVIEKGSVSIDGISLTINSCGKDRFSVSIIPQTLQVTTLGNLRKGSMVNIEVDIIGKYVEKLLSAESAAQTSTGQVINPGFLSRHGFI